jgi:hypothetical protein
MRRINEMDNINNLEKLKKWLNEPHKVGDKSEDFGDRIVIYTGEEFRVFVQRPGTKVADFHNDYSREMIEDANEKALAGIVKEIFRL